MIGGREREVVYRRREKKRGDKDGEIKREGKKEEGRKGGTKERYTSSTHSKNNFSCTRVLYRGTRKDIVSGVYLDG